jgi:HEAT repeat protein
MFALASQDSIKCKLVEIGALRSITQCLSHSTKIQEYAAGAIANIAICASGKVEVLKKETFLPLCELLMHSSNSNVLQQVARVFFALSAIDTSRDLIAQASVIPRLVTLLNHGSLKVQQNAAATIANIALTEQFRSLIINTYNVFEPLLCIAKKLQTSCGTGRHSARALFHLSLLPHTFSCSSDKNPGYEIWRCGVQPLITLLELPEYDVNMYAAGTIANIVVQEPRNVEEIVKLGGLAPLVHLLKCPEVNVQKRALRAITGMAIETCHIMKILQEGALIPILKILRHGHSELQCHACLALSNLATVDIAQSGIVQNGAAPLLIELTMSPDPDTQQHAICCMKHLGIPHIQPVTNDRVPTLQLLCENMIGDNLDKYARAAQHNLPTILQTTTDIPAPRLQAKSLLYCTENLLHPKEAWQHDIARTCDPATNTLIQRIGARWGYK